MDQDIKVNVDKEAVTFAAKQVSESNHEEEAGGGPNPKLRWWTESTYLYSGGRRTGY